MHDIQENEANGQRPDIFEAHKGLPDALEELPRVIVVSGHYGVGKTNFSMNLALDMKAGGKEVCLIDLDVVNPYFRSSDYPHILEDAGIDLLAPEFSQSALDAPMLSGRIATEINKARKEENRVVIIDAGGDDVGATALGSYADTMNADDYAMLYVVNAFREMTVDPHEAALLLPEIEGQAKCQATAIVNNSHLQGETDAQHIIHGFDFARTVADKVGLPILCHAVPAHLSSYAFDDSLAGESIYFVRRLVTTPWDAE